SGGAGRRGDGSADVVGRRGPAAVHPRRAGRPAGAARRADAVHAAGPGHGRAGGVPGLADEAAVGLVDDGTSVRGTAPPARGQDGDQCASAHVVPSPNSTSSGTASCAAPRIDATTNGPTSATSAGGASSTSSSWTCSSIRA